MALVASKTIISIQSYCAERERSPQEVRTRLQKYQVREEEKEEIISSLTQDGFLDEKRFARQFTDLALYRKQWGREKIKAALIYHGLCQATISQALKQIPEEDYLQILEQLMFDQPHDKNLYYRMVARGFEEGLVEEILTKKRNH